MKISIIYYSETGNTETVARWVSGGACGVENTETRLFNLRDNERPDKTYIESCDAVIFGTPTYMANMCLSLIHI